MTTSFICEPLLLFRMEGGLITGPFLLAMILNKILLSQARFVGPYRLPLILDSLVMGCISVSRFGGLSKGGSARKCQDSCWNNDQFTHKNLLTTRTV